MESKLKKPSLPAPRPSMQNTVSQRGSPVSSQYVQSHSASRNFSQGYSWKGKYFSSFK